MHSFQEPIGYAGELGCFKPTDSQTEQLHHGSKPFGIGALMQAGHRNIFGSETIRPFHRTMKNPKHDYAVAAMNVRHHIGQPRDYEFAGPFHPALASHPRVLYEHFDLSTISRIASTAVFGLSRLIYSSIESRSRLAARDH